MRYFLYVSDARICKS